MGAVANRHRGVKITKTEDLARLYFETYFVKLRACTGDTEIPQHWEIYETPHGRFHLDPLTLDLRDRFSGDVAQWFRNYVSVNKSAVATPCWRTIEGKCLCDGSASSLDIPVSIPIMLIVEIGDDHDTRNTWDFPINIRPLSKEAETTDGLVYNIVGRAFYSASGAHFTTRFTDNGRRVFDYDDIAGKGRAFERKGAKVKSHLAGLDSKIETPDGYITKAVVYRLRGGRKAQARFTRDQIAQSQRIHPVLEFTPSATGPVPAASITGTNIERLASVDRYWRMNPYTDKAAEYQLLPGTVSEVVGPTGKLKHTRTLSAESEQLALPVKRARNRVDSLDLPDSPCPIPESQAITPAATETRSPMQVEKPLVDEAQNSPPRTPWIRKCWPCGARGDGYDDADSDQVQCEKCECWSHIRCLDSAINYKAAKTVFICTGCMVDGWDEHRTDSEPR